MILWYKFRLINTFRAKPFRLNCRSGHLIFCLMIGMLSFEIFITSLIRKKFSTLKQLSHGVPLVPQNFDDKYVWQNYI